MTNPHRLRLRAAPGRGDPLPPLRTRGGPSLEATLARRRPAREPSPVPLTLARIGQLCLRGGAGHVPKAAGDAAQDLLLLQATALGLGGVVTGAFDDRAVRALLELPPGEHPVSLVPVGHPRP